MTLDTPGEPRPTDADADPEITRADLAGKLVGRVKEIAGEILDNPELEHDGRDQQAEIDEEARHAQDT